MLLEYKGALSYRIDFKNCLLPRQLFVRNYHDRTPNINRLNVIIKKALLCFLLISFLLSIPIALSDIDYEQTDQWSFQSSAYFNFNHPVHLLSSPYLGVINDNSLAGYWNFDEGSGLAVNDRSGNRVNGTINNAVWAAGKFGDSLSFTGFGYVACGSEQGLNITGNAVTISAWLKSSNSSQQTIVGFTDNHSFLSIANLTKLTGWWKTSSAESPFTFALPSDYNDSKFHLAVLTYDSTTGYLKGYWDGVFLGQQSFGGVALYGTNNNITIGARNGGRSLFLDGSIDDVRIYNRSLIAPELMDLYTQPDPISLTDYYRYVDSATNNTLLIHLDNPVDGGNSTLVTCTDFFTDNRLTFTSNSTAIINLWTNMGCPVFTSGFWNSQNNTITLTLDASSTAELDWNQATPPPSALKFLSTSVVAGTSMTFSALWTDTYSLSRGGYVFSTNNTGQWDNASWVAFSSTPCWGNATLTLNNKVGAVVGFREYANNSLNVWADSGLYTVTTTNESSAPSPTPTSSSTPNTSPTPTTTPTPTATSPSSQTPPPTLTSTQDNLFSTQTIVIAASVVAVLFVLSVVAFKRGYISVEIVDEIVEGDVDGNGAEKQNESQDYMI